MKLRIRHSDYEAVRQVAAVSFNSPLEFPPETGCILLLGRNCHSPIPSLTVAGVVRAGDGDFEHQGFDALRFSSRYLRRALLEVRERGLAGFLTVHTHPMASDRVEFSPYDDACDPELMQNLNELQPEAIFGSVVLGKLCAAGRVWNKDLEVFNSLSEIVIVGDRLEKLPHGGSTGIAPSAREVFDRGMALTGTGAMAELSAMRVAVVGAGGTGSLVAELLFRAGVGEILLFDFDVATESNLNRVLHLRSQDVNGSRLKADRLKEVIEQTGLPTVVTVVPGGDITDAAIGTKLAGCDVLIGCVDRDWPRLVLSEIATQYLLPYIDVGTEIGVAAGQVCSLDVRASYVSPDSPCLLCSGLVSMERIRLEGYGQEELKRVLAMGYSTDVRISAPAVMDLNMKAASWATLVLRHLLQPFLDSPLPHSIRESITNFSTRTRFYAFRPGCPICGDSNRSGAGDTYPLTVRRAF
jgi:hypothetical protein